MRILILLNISKKIQKKFLDLRDLWFKLKITVKNVSFRFAYYFAQLQIQPAVERWLLENKKTYYTLILKIKFKRKHIRTIN